MRSCASRPRCMSHRNCPTLSVITLSKKGSGSNAHAHSLRPRSDQSFFRCVAHPQDRALRHSAYRLDAEVRYFIDLLAWLDDPAKNLVSCARISSGESSTLPPCPARTHEKVSWRRRSSDRSCSDQSYQQTSRNASSERVFVFHERESPVKRYRSSTRYMTLPRVCPGTASTLIPAIVSFGRSPRHMSVAKGALPASCS